MPDTNLFQDDGRLVLQFQPVIQLTEEQFFQFCQLNRELRIEQTAQGEVEIMVPTGGETGWRNSKLIIALGTWTEQDGTGVEFDSSTGFILPNGATRSPDASWVKQDRLKGLSPQQQKKFLPVCPDFVIELRSPSDSLKTLQNKMLEYCENGTQLGWLIDQKKNDVYIYRPGKDVECLHKPATLSGEPELPGFVMPLNRFWRGWW